MQRPSVSDTAIPKPRQVMWTWCGLAAGYIALACVLGFRLGQDVSWDLRNYHFYVPYLAVNDRFETDVHAAGVQSFINPVFDLPFFFAVRNHVPPIVIGLALSAFHGLALLAVHRITVLLLSGVSAATAHMAGAIAALTGAFGAAYYSGLGSTMGDSTVATLVIGAVALLLADADGSRPARRLANCVGAGSLYGLAAGAKMVVGMFGPGLLVAAVWPAAPLAVRARRGLAFLAACGVAALVTGGYWMWLLFDHYRSPTFPFYNHIFMSPFAPPRDFSADYFAQLSSRQVPFSLPFRFVEFQMVSAEMPFRDPRILAGWLSLIVMAAIALPRLRRQQPQVHAVNLRRVLMTGAFFALSYAMWATSLTLYRFAMTLELLAAPVAVAGILSLVRVQRGGLALAAATCLALALFTRPLDFGRIRWTNDYFGVSTEALADYRGVTVVMADFPSGYVIPFFPRSAIFIRLISNWGLSGPLLERSKARLAATPRNRAFLLEHPGSVESGQTRTVLTALGYRVNDGACQSLASHFETMRMCPLDRSANGTPTP